MPFYYCTYNITMLTLRCHCFPWLASTSDIQIQWYFISPYELFVTSIYTYKVLLEPFLRYLTYCFCEFLWKVSFHFVLLQLICVFYACPVGHLNSLLIFVHMVLNNKCNLCSYCWCFCTFFVYTRKWSKIDYFISQIIWFMLMFLVSLVL